MAKMTLLQMVQETLLANKMDNVTDITETPDSVRVSKIIRQVYDQEFASGDWDHLKYIGRLEGLGDATKPTSLKIPDNVDYIDVVRYQYTDDNGDIRKPIIDYVADPQEFLEEVLSRRTTDTEVVTSQVPSEDVAEIFVYNDREPTFWTTFDGEHIVMDAYDSTVDSTLQGSKTLVTGKRETTWTEDNTFVPDMPSDMFPQFLSRCIVVAAEREADKPASVDRQAENRLRPRQRRSGGKTDVQHRKQNWGRK